jgi:hypothetical protein
VFGLKRDRTWGRFSLYRGDDDEITDPYIAIADDVCPSFDDRKTYPGHAKLQSQATGRPFST